MVFRSKDLNIPIGGGAGFWGGCPVGSVLLLVAMLWVPMLRAHEGNNMLGNIAVEEGGVLQVEFELPMSVLMTATLARGGGLLVPEGGEETGGAASLLGEMVGMQVGGESFWPEPRVEYIEVEAGDGTERHAIFVFRGEGLGGGDPGVVVSLEEDAPFSLVLLFERDGKQERRSQVLFPGEASRPYPLSVGGQEESAGGGGVPVEGAGGIVEVGGAEDAVGGGALETVWDYLRLGFRHIVAGRLWREWGYDHILFVLALFFLSTNWRALLAQVTCFTLAHTVTLGLGAAGLINLPGRLVETLIAASIVFVALENLWRERLGPWRLVVVVLFGLLHGLGFAGYLGEEVGLPAGQFLWGLLGFNIGVEVGQLLVLLLVFLLCIPMMKKPWFRRKVAVPASLVIAGIALWWAFERAVLGG